MGKDEDSDKFNSDLLEKTQPYLKQDFQGDLEETSKGNKLYLSEYVKKLEFKGFEVLPQYYGTCAGTPILRTYGLPIINLKRGETFLAIVCGQSYGLTKICQNNSQETISFLEKEIIRTLNTYSNPFVVIGNNSNENLNSFLIKKIISGIYGKIKERNSNSFWYLNLNFESKNVGYVSVGRRSKVGIKSQNISLAYSFEEGDVFRMGILNMSDFKNAIWKKRIRRDVTRQKNFEGKLEAEKLDSKRNYEFFNVERGVENSREAFFSAHNGENPLLKNQNLNTSSVVYLYEKK